MCDENKAARCALDLRAAGSSERGGRYTNEDWFIAESGFACLSDGIGGAAHGEVMSRVCCGALRDAWCALGDGGLSGAARMQAAFAQADAFASRVGGYLGTGSGATLVAAAMDGGQLVFGAAGDSAAFVLCGAELVPALAGDGRRAGAGNALESALGYGAVAAEPGLVRLASAPARAGERALLCSDGVWTQLEPEFLAALMGAATDPASGAYRIVRTAAEAGGTAGDNATAVAIHIETTHR